jgi:hypothetical protein
MLFDLFEFLELILNIIDHPIKTLITGYRLPLEPLKPFYPYHLELEQVREDLVFVGGKNYLV